MTGFGAEELDVPQPLGVKGVAGVGVGIAVGVGVGVDVGATVLLEPEPTDQIFL